MAGMNNTNTRWTYRSAITRVCAVSAIVASSMASPVWSRDAAVALDTRSDVIRAAWHHTAVEAAPVTWSFAAPQQGAGSAWTAERGRMTPGTADARLQPDTSRRVILVSSGGLPEAVRYAEEFVVNIPAEAGLQRVRVQARRDARGGWITIADGKGSALRAAPDGIAVKRNPGARDLPIESLRFEFSFSHHQSARAHQHHRTARTALTPSLAPARLRTPIREWSLNPIPSPA
jgi:hypothetical protein